MLEDPRRLRHGFKVHLGFYSAKQPKDVAAVAPALGKVLGAGECAGAATYEEARLVGVQKVVPERYLIGNFTSTAAPELLVELKIEWCNQQRRAVIDERLALYRVSDGALIFDVSRANLMAIWGLMDFDDDGLLEALVQDGVRFAEGVHRLVRFTPTGLDTLWLGKFLEDSKACELECCESKRLRRVVGLTFHQTSLTDAEMLEELWEAPCAWHGEDAFKLIDQSSTHVPLKASGSGSAP